MSTATASTTATPVRKPLGQQLVRIMTTTDHKLIGKMYLITSFGWFMVGGLMAMLIRSELAEEGAESDAPLLGGANARTQAGLDDESEGGHE